MKTDDLPIVSPCTLPRGELDEEAPGIHCGQCDKPVYNLSRMTRAEAAALLSLHEREPCVAYEADAATGEIAFEPETEERRGPRLRHILAAVGVMAPVALGVTLIDSGAHSKVTNAFDGVRSVLSGPGSAAQPAPGGGMLPPSAGQTSSHASSGFSAEIEAALSNLQTTLMSPTPGTEAVEGSIPCSLVEEPEAGHGATGQGESATVQPVVPQPDPERVFLRGDIAFEPDEHPEAQPVVKVEPPEPLVLDARFVGRLAQPMPVPRK